MKAVRLRGRRLSLGVSTERRTPLTWGPLLYKGSDDEGGYWELAWHWRLRRYFLVLDWPDEP